VDFGVEYGDVRVKKLRRGEKRVDGGYGEMRVRGNGFNSPRWGERFVLSGAFLGTIKDGFF
jgi:hypothetical protein